MHIIFHFSVTVCARKWRPHKRSSLHSGKDVTIDCAMHNGTPESLRGTWKVISYLLHINFISDDIHGWSCKWRMKICYDDVLGTYIKDYILRYAYEITGHNYRHNYFSKGSFLHESCMLWSIKYIEASLTKLLNFTDDSFKSISLKIFCFIFT